MTKNKEKLQTLIFDKKYFNKSMIRNWIKSNDFIIDKRLRKPIMDYGNFFRVRQRNPDWFDKKTFTKKGLGLGVKGVYGVIKK